MDEITQNGYHQLFPCPYVHMYSSVIFSRAASNVQIRWLEKYFLFIKRYHIINHPQAPFDCVIPEEIFFRNRRNAQLIRKKFVYMSVHFTHRQPYFPYGIVRAGNGKSIFISISTTESFLTLKQCQASLLGSLSCSLICLSSVTPTKAP